MKLPSILVIDDEPDNFDVIETILSHQNYQLHYAAQAEEAIASLDHYNPDLILLDVMIPGMDGIEACQRIKAIPRWHAVPIMMVTSLNTKSDLASCLHAGADDFVSKPINAIELQARVQSLLRVKQHYDDLQRVLQLREDMVNMIVHDLRNPLTSVLFGLDTLTDPDLSLDEQTIKVSRVRLAGQQLQMLIDDLLMIAKMESGQLHLNQTEVDLRWLMLSALSGFEAISTQRKLELVSELPEHGSIIVDVAMFRRVLDNLLSNAIKFSPRHSKIVLRATYLPSGEVSIQVVDNGPGISQAFQQKIFEKYEIGNPMPGVTQIGLGLAFCKMITEAHQGSIGVSNNTSQGATFEVTLPANRVIASELPNPLLYCGKD
ncbi:response regulator [Oscillatoria sp. FACHB-1407]|uniref:hybrid sensor histidine kinase/response regulator n=1 Tax=Oscillatoria sp. FACHB-1407 TaxID=2692847 RepID=UPI001682675C|nr:response regulator [Oscillatoria sp. FACHB-1407]MBD2459516.1 response regulator [Oscillatoria sp. FACHB-1407]